MDPTYFAVRRRCNFPSMTKSYEVSFFSDLTCKMLETIGQNPRISTKQHCDMICFLCDKHGKLVRD